MTWVDDRVAANSGVTDAPAGMAMVYDIRMLRLVDASLLDMADTDVGKALVKTHRPDVAAGCTFTAGGHTCLTC